MANYVVTLRRELEWQGVIQAGDPVEALHEAYREARFEEVIDDEAIVKELVVDSGSEIEVEVLSTAQ